MSRNLKPREPKDRPARHRCKNHHVEPRCFLNTYTPLVASKAGRVASAHYGIPPFVDGSIRREPDFEHALPAISCLCRAGKFAPRLHDGDTIAYVTCKRKFGAAPQAHRRLAAVLRVQTVFTSHEGAADSYCQHGMPLPNNCVVPGNPAKLLKHSHRLHRERNRLDDQRLARVWDADYRVRVSRYGTVVVCRPRFRNLSWDAPVVENIDLITAFGRIPGTQNPGALSVEGFYQFLTLMGISVTPAALSNRPDA